MPSFLSSSDLSRLQTTFQNHFETFSSGISNYVTVFREPIKVINDINSQNLYGYSEDSLNPTDITYIPDTGVFPCMVIYPHSMNAKNFVQLKNNIDENQVLIKVEENAKNYIMAKKLEYMTIHDNKYNLISTTPQIQNYFGNIYYYFKLQIVY